MNGEGGAYVQKENEDSHRRYELDLHQQDPWRIGVDQSGIRRDGGCLRQGGVLYHLCGHHEVVGRVGLDH